MYKFLLFVFIGVAGIFALPHIGLAVPENCAIQDVGQITDLLKDCAGKNGIAPDQYGEGTKNAAGFRAYVMDIAGNLLSFAALFAIGALVFAGIRYATAYWDDEKHKSAKTIATYAIVGLFLALAAFPLVRLVVDFIYNLS